MRNRPDALLMFAAGFGTRMKPLTDKLPKPLVEVAGRPLIDHALSIVQDHGVSRVVANLHYKADMIRNHLAETRVLFSEESPDILETGGGLRAALPLLEDGPVFTMNSDAVWSGPNPLTLLSQAWQSEDMDALLLCIPKANALGHYGTGDFGIDADGRAYRGTDLVYSGVQIICPTELDHFEDRAFSLNCVWDRMIDAGRLFGLPYQGRWCDVGQPASIAIAEDMLAASHV